MNDYPVRNARGAGESCVKRARDCGPVGHRLAPDHQPHEPAEHGTHCAGSCEHSDEVVGDIEGGAGGAVRVQPGGEKGAVVAREVAEQPGQIAGGVIDRRLAQVDDSGDRASGKEDAARLRALRVPGPLVK